ncbi:hypothetical protein EXIGLDRAFT_593983, partial [Exidia glandulosa HHB12029]
ELSEDDLNALRGFAFKTEQHATRNMFESLPNYFPGVKTGTHDNNRARVTFLSGIKPTRYDCCADSCVLFVGRHEKLDKCPTCAKARYTEDGKPVKQFAYLPIIPRLIALYKNEATAQRQFYRDEATKTYQRDTLRDYIDGDHYRELLHKEVHLDGLPLGYRFFADMRDIALGLSTDGFAPFKKRKQTC